MRSPLNVALFYLVVALTTFAVLVVWPDKPDRYLPDSIPWPSGVGLKWADREEMRLGLDLKGGTYVLLEADTSRLPPGVEASDAMDVVKEVIERRVNAFGVSETEIQREGPNRLSVQLPGISPDEARDLIGRTALLEFLEPKLDEQGNILCKTAKGKQFGVPPPGPGGFGGISPNRATGKADCLGGAGGQIGQAILIPATCKSEDCDELAGQPLTGSYLRPTARVGPDVQGGGFVVTLDFNGQGADIFSDVTGRLVGYPLAISLDGEIISAPTVQAQLGENAVITGLGLDEAKRLRVQLNSGALPVPLNVIQQNEVDATLGDETVRRSAQAGLIGILAVMAFMVLYYRLPGVLAALALVVYSSTVLLIFKILPITITLAGIAGFVLSVGMAVDANVLVFERMKEELRAGRTLTAAIETGFDRAWSSIRDSNVSTLITCVILWWFGDQFNAALVKGFAITLGIGVLVSMFSAITVTRTFLRLLVGTPVTRNLWLFAAETVAPRARPVEAIPDGEPARRGGAAPFMLDFVRRRHLYFLFSFLILLPGIISLLIPPSLKPGIEFTAGTTFTIEFKRKGLDTEDLRAALADMGQPQARVQETRDGAFIVRMGELEGATNVPPVGPTPPSERDAIEQELRDRFGAFEVTNFNTVSEIVSRSIGRNAAIALATAAIAILLYISWSFRNLPKPYRYGIAAVLATMHDALFVLGAFSIFGKVFGMEVNTMFITGLLTVIGFSVHDTIVVFDRIRENVTKNPDVPFDEVVNASLTQTLGRSINTSMTVVFTILALLLLGGVAIQSFLVVLLIGVLAGTYSSIFVASQILVAWEDGDVARLWRRLFPRRQVPAEV
ncbi:MAG: protein translocase subunit SecD [Chloroflexi bacterium]|nr:protein translocase subunit SecD [Chloroflexota bacterium]